MFLMVVSLLNLLFCLINTAAWMIYYFRRNKHRHHRRVLPGESRRRNPRAIDDRDLSELRKIAGLNELEEP